MPRKKRKPEELRAVWEHLGYETDMLTDVARELATAGRYPWAVKNALVESYAIHLRNVIEFLWPPDSPNKDLVTADDFLASPLDWQPPSIPNELKDARRRASQQVSHLSYARLRVTLEGKQWTRELAAKVVSAFNEFLTHIPEEHARPLA